ncbi:isopenicillin N synthase family dioxygenase [Streptomyces sp. NBC_01465]|uniref:isopenicillin N synthase family dioxygenase n=1 Tax=Streptomyces sp. NBC_01465 TaxID=2903878 RepID=UPI002E35CF99|nr:2-oxoglutarate and iron-dependent oxygenase domain-containing protein [Streptomyces sp. NBC_01465]
MSSADFTALPVVDISALREESGPERAAAVAELGRAARDTGFLYVSGHGVDPALFERLLRATRDFFARPVEEKMRCWIGNSSNHRGYVPEGEEVFAGGTPDRKEAFDLSLELPDRDNPLTGPNQWPATAGFREAVTAWYDAVFALGRTLFGGFAEALGLERDAFTPYLTRPTSQLRLIHYPYDPTAEDRPGIGAHTDYECFTLLRPTAPGLEVMNGSGQWIDAPPLGDCFVVNTGDLLELWTNGEFAATSHRVRKVAEERYSFPLFCTVDYDTRIAPLPAFTGPGRPARAGVVAGEHLYAQTVQTFGYLRERLAAGEIALPDGALALSSFGQEARHTPVVPSP